MIPLRSDQLASGLGVISDIFASNISAENAWRCALMTWLWCFGKRSTVSWKENLAKHWNGSNLKLRASEEDATSTTPGLPDPSVFINMMGDQKSKGGKWFPLSPDQLASGLWVSSELFEGNISAENTWWPEYYALGKRSRFHEREISGKGFEIHPSK